MKALAAALTRAGPRPNVEAMEPRDHLAARATQRPAGPGPAVRRATDRAGCRGCTLVEALAATAILGLVALGVAGLLARALAVNASGHGHALLTAVANQALDELRSRPFADPALDPTAGALRSWPDPTGSGRFDISYAVSAYRVSSWDEVEGVRPWPAPPSGLPANLKRITVTARLTVAAGPGRRELTVAALLAR